MRFSWNLLQPVTPVPYVPTLGPARPDDPLHDLFEAVVENAATDRFLPYDKDQRWSESKNESVLPDTIEHGPHLTLIPTITERDGGVVKVYVYGSAPDSLSAGSDLARKLAPAHGARRAGIVWFLGPDLPGSYSLARGTRVQLKDFTDGPREHPHCPVTEYQQLHEPGRFAAFAERMSGHGFAPLYDHMRAGTVGPVLLVLQGGHVAGAIGPMETLADVAGRTRLLPQYFGVLPEYRGRGLGRALWRAAMHWGHEHGAGYQLLQTEVGGASDRLCAAEGLTSLGFVNLTAA